MTTENVAKDRKAKTLQPYRRLMENYVRWWVAQVQMAGGRAVNVLAGLQEVACDRLGSMR